MEENNYWLKIEIIEFFNFRLHLTNGEVTACSFNWEWIDTDIWKWIYAIMQKYDEKNEKMKRRKAMFDEKQKNYCIEKQAREQRKKALWLHIEKAEQKLSEYKNVILAFGKLASTSAITK